MEIYFSKEHEWIKVNGSTGIVGISEHAAHELGDVTYVELPQEGKSVRQFQELASIESVKAASDIYAPVSGTVTKVNTELEQRPEIVNESAEDAAWICELTISDPAELKNLMNKAEYEAFLQH
jgi:glycine cleavage system H protein